MRRTNFWFVIRGTLKVFVMALILPVGAGAASNFKVLYRFQGGADGAIPSAGLVFDAAGNLYGTTYSGGDLNLNYCGGVGCGTVFRLTPNSGGSWTKTVLYSFKGAADGRYPNAALVFDSAGNLYGTTVNGGLAGDNGVVFKLTRNPDESWTESVLHRLSFLDGANPTAGVVFDTAGNLFGTTYSAGGTDGGVVFELKPNSDGTWTESVIHGFQGFAHPYGGLIFDDAGNLYGTASDLGPAGDGEVYKLTPTRTGGWAGTTIYSFLGNPAQHPDDSLVFDKSGNLYGTTPSCGRAYNCSGVVFEVTP